MTEQHITLRLTVDEARALLIAPDIDMFPENNTLGQLGVELLGSAREKLNAVLEEFDD